MTPYKIILLLLATLLSAMNAEACSCARAASAQAQAQSADLIFVGTAFETVSFGDRGSKQDQAEVPNPRLPDGLRAFSFNTKLATTFKTTTVLKGTASGQSITLHYTQANGANCGMTFKTGQEYFILAYMREDGTYATNSCFAPQFPRAAFEAILTQPD